MKGEGYLFLELFVYRLFHALATQWRVAPILFVGFFAAARWLRNSLISESCGLRAALQHKGATAKASGAAARMHEHSAMPACCGIAHYRSPALDALPLPVPRLSWVQIESGQYLERSQCECAVRTVQRP